MSIRIAARRAGLGLAAAALVGAVALGPEPARAAAGPPALAAPATVAARTGTPTQIGPLTLEAHGQSEVQVFAGVDHGVLWLGTTTGLTFTVGDGVADPSLQFTGSVAAVQAALDALYYVADVAFTGTDVLTLKTTYPGMAWLAGNEHFYEYVADPDLLTLVDAQDQAAARPFGGATGYLLTVTSAAEQTFVTPVAAQASVTGGWLGALLVETDLWTWTGGPDDELFGRLPGGGGTTGYEHWAPGQPDDLSALFVAMQPDGEWFVVGGPPPGGYFVEYGGQPSDPPLVTSVTVGLGVTYAPLPPPTTAPSPPPPPTAPSPGHTSAVTIRDGQAVVVPVHPAAGTDPIVAATPSGKGSWAVRPDGGVFTAGDATFHGSLGAVPLASPIVGIAPTATGRGYLLVGADGGVFTFGDATFAGSLGGLPLNQPITGIAATCTGAGYLLVGADGGVFTFGDATFAGSLGGFPLNQPVAGLTAHCAGGYWLYATDGGVFAFGAAPFHGSLGAAPPAHGLAGLVAAPGGTGYWLISRDGIVTAFGA